MQIKHNYADFKPGLSQETSMFRAQVGFLRAYFNIRLPVFEPAFLLLGSSLAEAEPPPFLPTLSFSTLTESDQIVVYKFYQIWSHKSRSLSTLMEVESRTVKAGGSNDEDSEELVGETIPSFGSKVCL